MKRIPGRGSLLRTARNCGTGRAAGVFESLLPRRSAQSRGSALRKRRRRIGGWNVSLLIASAGESEPPGDHTRHLQAGRKAFQFLLSGQSERRARLVLRQEFSRKNREFNPNALWLRSRITNGPPGASGSRFFYIQSRSGAAAQIQTEASQSRRNMAFRISGMNVNLHITAAPIV